MIKYLLLLNPKTPNALSAAKRKIAIKFKSALPTNIQLLKAYRQYLKENTLKPDAVLLCLLKRRQVRTDSGVAPVAILTKPYPCPGKCFYCPNEKSMPKSYLSNEPAVMRAILNKFDAYKQVRCRLEALEMTGHYTDKIEIIIMGGTWSYLPRNYQFDFVTKCFAACNDLDENKFFKTFSLKSKKLYLRKLQKLNEKALHRIVGLTLETRPDYITPDEIKRMRELGCTRVELGVQAIDDKILDISKRGHNTQSVIGATKLLKQAGLKVTYHMMVGLPGSSQENDFNMFKNLFSNQDFQPDMLKIYPCVITKNAPLYKWYKQGKYKPYSEQKLFELLIKIKEIVPPYVRIIRIIRDIPNNSIIAGNKISNLREDLHKFMRQKNRGCRCIRCREIKSFGIKSCHLKIRSYSASGGKEYFFSYEDFKQDKIIAFLRLRISKDNNMVKKIFPVLKNAAIIREVHTYGPIVPITQHSKKSAQHSGLGKKLIKKAEEIVLSKGYSKMTVISGVGVRDYYRKLGYKLKDGYMIKKLVN